jgi:hypothetical protein
MLPKKLLQVAAASSVFGDHSKRAGSLQKSSEFHDPVTQQGYGCIISTCNPNNEQVTLSNGMCNYMRLQMFMCFRRICLYHGNGGSSSL